MPKPNKSKKPRKIKPKARGSLFDRLRGHSPEETKRLRMQLAIIRKELAEKKAELKVAKKAKAA